VLNFEIHPVPLGGGKKKPYSESKPRYEATPEIDSSNIPLRRLEQEKQGEKKSDKESDGDRSPKPKKAFRDSPSRKRRPLKRIMSQGATPRKGGRGEGVNGTPKTGKIRR